MSKFHLNLLVQFSPSLAKFPNPLKFEIKIYLNLLLGSGPASLHQPTSPTQSRRPKVLWRIHQKAPSIWVCAFRPWRLFSLLSPPCGPCLSALSSSFRAAVMSCRLRPCPPPAWHLEMPPQLFHQPPWIPILITLLNPRPSMGWRPLTATSYRTVPPSRPFPGPYKKAAPAPAFTAPILPLSWALSRSPPLSRWARVAVVAPPLCRCSCSHKPLTDSASSSPTTAGEHQQPRAIAHCASTRHRYASYPCCHPVHRGPERIT
jgi:hypothetical protein